MGSSCGSYYRSRRCTSLSKAQALGKELGVKVIYGVEGYLIDDEIVTRDEEPVVDKKKKKKKINVTILSY